MTPQQQAAKAAVRDGYARAAAGWERWKRHFLVAGRAATEVLVLAADISSGQRVLDLAGGAGEPGVPLARRVGPEGTVTVTDLVPEMLTVARAYAAAEGVTNITFGVADAERLPFPDAVFDRVTCRFAAMHFPSAEGALRETRRVLQPGGRAAFTVLGPPEQTPAFMCTAGVVLRQVPAPPPVPGYPSPYRFATPGVFATLMRDAGFLHVEDAALTVPSPWPGPPGEYWRSLPDHATGLTALLDQLTLAQRAAVEAEVLAALHHFDTGEQLAFTQPMLVITGVAPDCRS